MEDQGGFPMKIYCVFIVVVEDNNLQWASVDCRR